MFDKTDINGVLAPTIVDNKYVFTKVPKGKEVTLIAFKNEQGKLLSAFKKLLLSEEGPGDLVFTETSLAGLKAALQKI